MHFSQVSSPLSVSMYVVKLKVTEFIYDNIRLLANMVHKVLSVKVVAFLTNRIAIHLSP